YQAGDGQPFSVFLGGDPLGQKNVEPTTPPDVVQAPGCTRRVNPGDPLHYIKSECCSFAASAQLRGDAGRNILIGPGLSNLDFSVFKNNRISRISEAFNIQFRVEAFN